MNTKSKPAGNDHISMVGVRIYGEGTGMPVKHTMNGLIVNLDGYTLYAPGATPAPALIETLRANGDRIAMEATIAQQAQRIADLEAGTGKGEPVAWLNVATGQVTTCPVVVMDWDDEKEQVQSLYTEQPAPVAVVMPERDILRDIIAQTIGGDTYDCTRVWSAWGAGTMSEDDFFPVVEQEDRLYEIADAFLDEVARLNPIKQ